MNIKSVVSSQRVRHAILKALSWVPDWVMLRLQYRAVLGRWPDLSHPKRYTEWINWYKMNVRDEKMSRCVDKYLARDYVKSKIGGGYLVDLYAVSDDARHIGFDSLPDKFVIKTTDGGNGDNVLICRNKNELDIEATVAKVDSWRNKKYFSVSREWAYVGARDSRVIVEELLEDDSNADGSIDDYKFLCFNGKFRCLWVDKGRYSDHHRGFWDENLRFLPDVVSDHPTFDIAPSLPENVAEMVKVAEKLAEDFRFARVDLYNIKGRIVFGEITFYPWSGYVNFTPDEFDFRLGGYFDAPPS